MVKKEVEINVKGDINRGTVIVGDGNRVENNYYQQEIPSEELPDISVFISNYFQQKPNFTQDQILDQLNLQLKTEKLKWQTCQLFVFPPTSPSLPKDMKELNILSFSKVTAIRIVVRIQIDERYKIKRKSLLPERDSHQKILEKINAEREELLPIEIEKIYSKNHVEKGSYERQPCTECNGSRVHVVDGIQKDCFSCNGFGYTENYTEKIRYVYPREKTLFIETLPRRTSIALPPKRWKKLWKIEKEKLPDKLPFRASGLDRKLNEINTRFKETLREIEIDIKGLKIRPRIASEIEKYNSSESYEKNSLLKILSDLLDPTIMESFVHEMSEMHGSKLLHIEPEAMFANQYQCAVEGVTLYELNYERHMEYNEGIWKWKKTKKGVVKGEISVMDGINGLEVYKQSEEIKNYQH